MILLAASILLTPLAAPATRDWPQYHGSAGDRTSSETIELAAWTDAGPPVVWKVPTRAGFSSFAVADGRAYTLVLRDGAEALVALDAGTGQELWATRLGPVDYDGGGGAGAEGNEGGDGPRSTPSVDGERVYAFDAGLVLHCFESASGKRRWTQNLAEDFDGQEIQWQNAASPLVEGERVFVVGGGKGRTFLAFDKRSGALAWATGDERMTHATPTPATIHGRRQIVFLVEYGLVALDPGTGEELWRAPYPYRTSTAASPVVYEDRVYVSAGYGVGGGAYRIESTEEGFRATQLWHHRNDLMNHWSTPVCRDGYLYGMFGFKKYGEAPLACVSIETGATMWSTPGFGPGNAIAVGDTLVALSDAGEVVLVALDPGAYRERARARVLTGKCWSSPSFADGQLYVRSTAEGARLDLSGGGG